MEAALWSLTLLTDSSVNLFCWEVRYVRGKVKKKKKKKGWIEGATSKITAAFPKKIKFHLVLQEKTRPVVQCLDDNCCETRI